MACIIIIISLIISVLRAFSKSCYYMEVIMEIKVVELFAGVGGFRLGLENSSDRFKTVWANQWEPSRKIQHAFHCYNQHFGENKKHVNEDITLTKHLVPNHDLLVGGFPCQDYSVARTQAKGLEGKKGVLWWEIRDILENKRPKYILLENVDRLLKSPASQRGRDFGVILRCLHDLGYGVEWRVINAADYGYAQRRRRVYIFAFHNSTNQFNILNTLKSNEVLIKNGLFANEFNVKDNIDEKEIKSYSILHKEDIEYKDLADFSLEFQAPFKNSGYLLNGIVYTVETKPIEVPFIPVKDILIKNGVDSKYFLRGDLDRWKYLKGAKKEPRIKPNGEPYFYAEGNMSFPDSSDLPSRTILTSESSVNRSSHVVKDLSTKELRLLTPIECERLNGFPDNWTNTEMPEKFRYFVMGNALVVPLITRIGNQILKL